MPSRAHHTKAFALLRERFGVLNAENRSADVPTEKIVPVFVEAENNASEPIRPYEINIVCRRHPPVRRNRTDSVGHSIRLSQSPNYEAIVFKSFSSAQLEQSNSAWRSHKYCVLAERPRPPPPKTDFVTANKGADATVVVTVVLSGAACATELTEIAGTMKSATRYAKTVDCLSICVHS